MVGSSRGSGTRKIMLELYNPAFKTQPVNATVLSPYQQEWTHSISSHWEITWLFCIHCLWRRYSQHLVWKKPKINLSAYLSIYEYLIIGSFLSKTSKIFCRDYYWSFLWICTGTALIYEGALRFSSSLLLSVESPWVPGRDSNLGLNFRQAGALTKELRHTKVQYGLFKARWQISWTIFLCRNVPGRGCVARGAGVQEIPRQNVQVSSESFVLEHC